MPDGDHWVYGCRGPQGWGVCIGSSDGIDRIAENFFRPAIIDGNSLAVVDSAGILYRIEIDSGAAESLWHGLPADGRFGWAVVGGDLIYLSGGEGSNTGRMIRRNLASGEELLLYEGPMPLADVAISHGARSGSILFTTYQSSSDDVVLFLNVAERE
jgi:hypothetical protein